MWKSVFQKTSKARPPHKNYVLNNLMLCLDFPFWLAGFLPHLNPTDLMLDIERDVLGSMLVRSTSCVNFYKLDQCIWRFDARAAAKAADKCFREPDVAMCQQLRRPTFCAKI